ncbi:MAG: COP23 domain-containing protein [Hormoscilla sp.]
MIAKPGGFTAKALATAMMLSGAVLYSTQPAAANPELDPTVFKCVRQGEGWATFAQRGNAVSTVPMIRWNTTEFGSDYTPENRCRIVSERLTKAVANNGGMLSNLDLTTGTLNDYPVVCFVTQNSSTSTCDNSNLLFTLNKQNASNPSQVLARLTNFRQGRASDSTIDENGGIALFISLETLVDRILPQDSGW